jgi:hypothetical protein
MQGDNMNFWNNFMQANTAAFQAWKRVFQDPSTIYAPSSFREYANSYELLWWYYDNQMFDRYNLLSQKYRERYGLYRNIRMIENPVRGLVDFYAARLYPGVLTVDGKKLPEGVQSAIPFSEDTPDALKSAVAQIWTWSNWQSKKSVEVRYGAALGDVFVEVVDDVESGKVYLDVLWPGFVCDLELDKAGNVKAYMMEYRVEERRVNELGLYTIVDTYVYRKMVDQQNITIYHNNQLVSTTPNPYGFAPGVWIKHSDCGTDHGACAFAGSMEKIDELNNTLSEVNDQIKKAVQNPRLLSTGSPSIIKQYFDNDKRAASSDIPHSNVDQEQVLVMTAAADTKVQSLLGDLNIADASREIDRLEALIEKSHPEIGFYHMLREMTYVSAPGALQLVGDVTGKLNETGPNYDRANIALFQMAVAIAGMRANEGAGAWAQRTNQQQKFASFNLDSYEQGNLDMAIMPRPLLTPTRTEQAQEKQTIWVAVKAATDAGVPLEMAVEDVAGLTPDQIQKLIQGKQKEEAAQQAQFEQQQKVIAQNATQNQPPSQPNQKQVVGQKG